MHWKFRTLEILSFPLANDAYEVSLVFLLSVFFSWAGHTLACFPAPLRQFYQENPCPHETKQVLRQRVEDEYRRWKCKYNTGLLFLISMLLNCCRETLVSYITSILQEFLLRFCDFYLVVELSAFLSTFLWLFEEALV